MLMSDKRRWKKIIPLWNPQNMCIQLKWLPAGSELFKVKNKGQGSWSKQCHWLSNILIYSLGSGWVNECKALHLVHVCQRCVWQPGPLNIVSTGPLIEPDQFTETASRLAQLPHQRDSNNCTLWPLPNLKKPYLCSLQSKHGSIGCPENAGLCYFFVNCLDTRSLWSSLGREQRWFTLTPLPTPQ